LGYFISLEFCFSVNLIFFVSGISELQVCVSAVADVLLWRQKYLSISILVGSTVIWFLLEKSQYTLVALLSNILFFTVIVLFVWANLAALLSRCASWFVQLQGHSKVKVLQYVTDMFLDIIFFRNWPSSITTAGMLLSISGTAQCDVLYISVLQFIPHAIHKLIPFCLTVRDLTLSEDVVLSTASALRVELNKVLEVVQDVAQGKDFKLFLKVPTSAPEWYAFAS
jgi:hypothetical protein